MPSRIPEPLLDVRVHQIDPPPGLTALCAGYELREWRAAQLARHLVDWLPEFALTHSELQSLGVHNLASLLARAAQVIYDTRTANPDLRDRRGEIGELLLHIAIRQVFDTLPAISKFYFKDSVNGTVKGFDAVHVVVSASRLELWLGEVKFKVDIAEAIREVVAEIEAHTKRDYLRNEFALISNKIDRAWPHAERLSKLLHKNTPLDQVFDCMAIPVLLTFESPVLQSHEEISDAFKIAFEAEVRKHHTSFCRKALPEKIRIHLFLFPMKDKKALVDEFDRRLEACQLIGR